MWGHLKFEIGQNEFGIKKEEIVIIILRTTKQLSAMPFKSILLFNFPTSLLWHTGVFNLLVHIHRAKKCQNKDLNWDYKISENRNCVLLKERDFRI